MVICYYCLGDHNTNTCIKEAQNQTTKAIEKIGYTQLSEMENLGLVYRDSAKEMSSSFERASDRISQSFDELSNAISELTEVFEYNHAEMMWQMERQLEVLTGIHDMVKNRRATEANELLKMGIESLKRDMIPESINLLEEAVELNPLDYRIYLTMGHAYLRMDDLKNALNSFEYSLKNARTNFYKSYSLLLISRVFYCLGDIIKAIENAKLATEKSPNYGESYYQFALYVAQNRQK